MRFSMFGRLADETQAQVEKDINTAKYKHLKQSLVIYVWR